MLYKLVAVWIEPPQVYPVYLQQLPEDYLQQMEVANETYD